MMLALLRGTFIVIFVWTAIGSFVDSAERPNILLIVSDDQGMNDVGCYGSEIPTPHIDSIARSGVKFESWYVATPQCTPSRFAMLTGRYPNRSQDRLMTALMFLSPGDARRGIRPEETTIAEVLKRHGYRTALFGKWHLGHGQLEFFPTRHGFETFYGCAGGCVDYFTLRYGNKPDWYRQEEPNKDQGYSTHLITDAAVRFLEGHEPGEPFFVYLPYTAPHYGNVWNTKRQAHDSILQPHPDSLEKVRFIGDRRRRDFAAMVSAMDDGIGRVLDVLRRRGLDKNTLVIFTSDNGADPNFGGSNLPFRGKKATLFEGGIRVPCVMSWPGKIKPGATSRQLGSALDLFPTLCRSAGAPLDGLQTDGIDLGSVLLEGRQLPRDLYWKTARGNAFRRGVWKYIKTRGGQEMLFDLGEDPGERVNLAADRALLVAQLRARHSAVTRSAVTRGVDEGIHKSSNLKKRSAANDTRR